jgi:hypothetical protein
MKFVYEYGENHVDMFIVKLISKYLYLATQKARQTNKQLHSPYLIGNHSNKC